MKKLICLLLVLGLCAVASATVTYSTVGQATPGGTFSIEVDGLVTDMTWKEGLYTSDGTEDGGLMDIEGATCYDGSGEVLEGYLTTCTYFPSWDGVDLGASDPVGSEPGSGSGTWFTIDVSVSSGAQSGDTLTFSRQNWADGSYDELGTFDVTVVPEPLTIGLLGLGGLLIRRRK